ncbi:hypothetical protein KM043_002926 [Ampulex compressa]|nr:hypothetical protein KM043_002926 [Ampulex compressa]
MCGFAYPLEYPTEPALGRTLRHVVNFPELANTSRYDMEVQAERPRTAGRIAPTGRVTPTIHQTGGGRRKAIPVPPPRVPTPMPTANNNPQNFGRGGQWGEGGEKEAAGLRAGIKEKDRGRLGIYNLPRKVVFVVVQVVVCAADSSTEPSIGELDVLKRANAREGPLIVPGLRIRHLGYAGRINEPDFTGSASSGYHPMGAHRRTNRSKRAVDEEEGRGSPLGHEMHGRKCRHEGAGRVCAENWGQKPAEIFNKAAHCARERQKGCQATYIMFATERSALSRFAHVYAPVAYPLPRSIAPARFALAEGNPESSSNSTRSPYLPIAQRSFLPSRARVSRIIRATEKR